MSRAYATPLELQLMPSRFQRRYFVFIYLLVACSILLLPVQIIIKLTAIFLLLLFAVYYFRYLQRFDRLVWMQGNHWLLLRGGTQLEARLLDDSIRTSWLVILNFRIVSALRPSLVSVVIWPDSLPAEMFRRLKVRLRVEGVHKD